ncbi:zinc-ribbon domain-containing protein [Promethearchaeum syntrophicum]|uniref:Zinc-ribbon domain-containing protein n=1 Tax=Promethearchaeum syntrophicum TaxID=2594042 RepID=A0A5B9DAV9_9ARCH|nr:zinc-ribbon domain-containing protein [Candidatus Prometheoarchaeum syntrophicum]QEE16283.1 hypothetical protein DSAG12_02113 [Candidatus Prometheoarchaeum syntrophicum]
MIFQEFLPYGFSLMTFLPTIIITIIRIGIAVFIAKDCQKRGMEPTMFIALTCCCGVCIGGIIYLITASNHPNEENNFQQPSFNSHQNQVYGRPQPIYSQPQSQPPQQTQPKPVYPGGNTTIPNKNTTICPVCGSQNNYNAKFCGICGADLK